MDPPAPPPPSAATFDRPEQETPSAEIWPIQQDIEGKDLRRNFIWKKR